MANNELVGGRKKRRSQGDHSRPGHKAEKREDPQGSRGIGVENMEKEGEVNFFN